MRFARLLATRFRSFMFRSRSERDLDEELRLHIERETERRVAGGLPPGEARARALRDFGGVEQMKERCREARGCAVAGHVVRDARHAVRRLARDWEFTVAAVLILALGIGANTAVFSLVNAALFRPLPFEDAGRLVDIYQNRESSGLPLGNSYPAHLEMTAYPDVFSDITAFALSGARYQAEDRVRTAAVEFATSSYLSVHGLEPALGRWFVEAEDEPGESAAGVVAHRTWTVRFGSDPTLIGRTVRFNGAPVTIVGVAPAVLTGSRSFGVVTDFWLSISSVDPVVVATGSGDPQTLGAHPYERVFTTRARLRDGVDIEQAQAAMDVLGARLAAEALADPPPADRVPVAGITVLDAGETRIHPTVDALLVPAASLLMAVVGLVLAIACSNLATLLLVRGASRSKEVSMRLALGATRAQVLRNLLTESVLLAAAGGVAGCLMAVWGIEFLTALDLPLIVDLGLDYRVLGFTVLLSVVTGIAFGLAPALKTTKVDFTPALRDEGDSLSLGRKWFSLKNTLVVIQIAVSFLLLIGLGHVLKTQARAQALDLGFAVEGVAILRTDARYAGYTPDRAQPVYEELRRRIASIPGVESVALTEGSRIGSRVSRSLLIDDYELAPGEPGVSVPLRRAQPAYFETLRIPVLFGRTFDEGDSANAPRIAVINESMARRYFGTVNAVGARFRYESDPDSQVEVVGVVGDTRDTLMENAGQPMFYTPFAQYGSATPTVLARTTLDASALVGAMQRELRALNPELPALLAETMETNLQDDLVAARSLAGGLGALGALGLALAGLGLYAVIAFGVSRRSLEIGIRMALGARRGHVIGTILGEVASLVGAGIVAGLILSFVGLQVLSALAFEASSTPGVEVTGPAADFITFVAVAVLMILMGLLAAYLPVRKAAGSDPLAVLRRQ